MTGSDFIELQRHGLHDKVSHDKDFSKTLAYDQIESVVETAKTTSRLSCAAISRNLQEHHDSPSKNIPFEFRNESGTACIVPRRALPGNSLTDFKLNWKIPLES